MNPVLVCGLWVVMGCIAGGALAWLGDRLFGRRFRRRHTPSAAHPAKVASAAALTEDERLWDAELEEEKS